MVYGNENDPFMRGESYGRGPAGGNAPASGAYASKGYQGGGGGSNVILLVVAPWLVFLFVSALFTYGYYHNAEFTWVACGFIAAVSVTAVVTSNRDAHPSSQGLSALGILTLFALVFGTLAGLYNYEAHMGPYWNYDESREYTNVLPSEPAASFMDAGKIQFAQAARVDTTESVGYKHGDTYCVAPIKDANSGSRVEFWAVCVNQCGGRRDFRCDDASDPTARGAVTLIDHSTFMPSQMEYFHRAVKEAEASFDLVSSSEPLFVRWLKDPDTYQKDMFDAGTGHFVLFLFIYFVFNGVLAMQANYLLNRK